MTEVTLSRTDAPHGFSDGYAECGEAVQDCHTDLELGNLTIEVPRHEVLAQKLQTVHPLTGSALRSNVTRGFVSTRLRR